MAVELFKSDLPVVVGIEKVCLSCTLSRVAILAHKEQPKVWFYRLFNTVSLGLSKAAEVECVRPCPRPLLNSNNDVKCLGRSKRADHHRASPTTASVLAQQ